MTFVGSPDVLMDAHEDTPRIKILSVAGVVAASDAQSAVAANPSNSFYPSAVGTINIAGFRARKNHRQRPVLCIMRHQLAIKTRQYVAIRIIAEGRAANLPWRMCRLTVTAIAAVLYVTGVVIAALLDLLRLLGL
jgi:hypothetical protein